MYSIRQGHLFSLQDLLPTERYTAIFEGINIMPLLKITSKKTSAGAPQSLNYSAMIYAMLARILEGVPTIALLVRRLKQDVLFRLDCGFSFSDRVPSESSFSRLIRKIKTSNVLAEINDQLLSQAMEEGFIDGSHIAIDATHIEARDQAPQKDEVEEEPAVKEPKKRGRKKKEDYEAWKKEQEEIQNNLPIFEQKIEKQLDYTFGELQKEMPNAPRWGIKKNSENKNLFWYGYKLHLAVETKSQYILGHLLSSGNMNDAKAAIPLLKGIAERFPILNITKVMADAGYDYKPIYEQIYRMKADGIIAYNKRNEAPPIGVDKYFAPTCVREYSYRYDSYDKKYETLKYTRPKECKDCPLAHDTLCQRSMKIKKTVDLRRYPAPARGSKSWKELYKERTSVERVNAYLKEYFQLNNIRYRSGELAKVHVDLLCLLFNASKLAVDRINTKLSVKAA
ncbi:IS1182 family transposase [Aneurinibacillus sp. Ricciae_BoGa-3]|uniref:IS1182 family transposase n=1 Tax=Aneurinibacillus sp. Ricciae_BoGa-3 TaxID=3022697 RepID=UPI002340AC02|nr:IS1182 family transposase [Aneurinibacillus sp. Ricciae_BoGa-3]WCK52528.1 IS1182 family transposase [Aneurinibacillus sp. Ricciae_BoGa-3]